jgi:hypothetical protein
MESEMMNYLENNAGTIPAKAGIQSPSLLDPGSGPGWREGMSGCHIGNKMKRRRADTGVSPYEVIYAIMNFNCWRVAIASGWTI